MTPKQMYSELAKIAGFRCESGERLAMTENVTGAELARMQRGLLGLLDKLNYRRCMSDFGRSPRYEEEMRRMERAERGAMERQARRPQPEARPPTLGDTVRYQEYARSVPMRYVTLDGDPFSQLSGVPAPPSTSNFFAIPPGEIARMQRLTFDESVPAEPFDPGDIGP